MDEGKHRRIRYEVRRVGYYDDDGSPLAADPTNPRHYAELRPEPIDVIEGWGLGPHEANVLKYIARAGRKGDALEDLRKARWYIDRRIAQLEASR